jgi:2-polyprenyl-6-methoxyphenol hydroxylase-like FAD-dependent oxidoreductase
MLADLGIVGEFLSAGRFLNAARLHGGRRLLAHIPFEPAGTEYPKPLMLAQSETERLLIEHLQRVGVMVERSVELTDFTDHGDHVLATLRHADGREEAIRCDWLLGCDGAHSTARKKAGLDFTGEAEPNDWVLADCHVEGPIPLDELSLFWHHLGVLVFFPFGPPGRCRVIADMGQAQGIAHPPDPPLAEVQKIVDARGPAGVRLSEPNWLAGFRIHERKVSEYRRGRVFLAGDAAHIHSPAGGQGMNTGMQDAWNLAWKLALVQRGQARPSLLDSYSQERGEVGKTVLRQATLLTWAATLRNPIAQFCRNRVVGLLSRLSSFRINFVRNLSEMSINYPHSPLNGESGGSSWSSGLVRPGDRMPDVRLKQPWTDEQGRLLSVLQGTMHDLLLLPAPNESALTGLDEIGRQVEANYLGLIYVHLIVSGNSLPAGAEGFTSVWLEAAGNIRRLLGARETALALVRPDGYLAYRCQPASWAELKAYLERYLIAGPQPPVS